ncbi:MAG: amidohydrolase [Clostridia bacterium]|nr:amidohydrolase [Clostridia bacterium]
MKILLHSAHVLTMDDRYTEFSPGWVLTEDSRIAALGEGAPPFAEADEAIDCRGGLLLPGFVNLHCHAAMVPFRTMGDDCPDRLRRFLFPLENEALTPALTRLGSLWGIAEMLLSGVTSFVDMYYFEEEVARACDKAGIRAWVGETVISQPSPDSPSDADGLQYAKGLAARWLEHPRVKTLLAPHGTTTVSPEALRRCGELAEETGSLLTLHVSEMDDEMRFFAERGLTPVQYLDSLGLVNERLLAVHCIHLTPEDVSLLAERGARVAHCPGSNTKAGKGVAPMKALSDARVPFGFGTDGPSSGNTLSLFDQMRLFALSQKTARHDRSLFPAREIVRAATRGGAEALGAADLGRIAPGMKADLIAVSTEAAHLFPVYNPYSALVYGANASDVSLTMADGRVLMRERRLLTVDLDSLRETLTAEMAPFRRAAEKYADII